jgi:signal transduction histidine kinase
MPTAEESKLAASLAHEINNPLDSVLNLLYLVGTEATLTDRGRRYLALAEEEVQRVAQIAHAALDRFRDCRAIKETNVPELLGSVIDLYKERFQARGIAINTRYGTDGNIAVFSDPLRQVFSNLLLNAADAMPRGGRIQARATRSHEWSGQYRQGIRMTFADTGCGIAAKDLHNIFEPFFTTKGSGGSGLGLSLVKDVVQLHDGSLRVRSSTKSGRSGSVFSIFLPAKSEQRSLRAA